ncbi:two-component regulator propeller domain-containing protein [Fodinibius saliphilus]|uniref:two-component regulator propeller domain-containing protein n=1 Tax=Fodinibius saliphilus TaxID=1920650 RepID=UPI0014860949|nr:two-component regulator propeller domain-containing protein [Fodinibius saliphilus]
MYKTFYIFLLLFGIPAVGLTQHFDFKIYSVNNGLPQAQVHDMVQTSDGFIWMATNGGGLSRFDGNTFKTYTTEDGLRNNAVQNIYEDSKGRLWVANYPGGVVTFEKDSLVNPFPQDSLTQYEVWQINEFNNEVWFGTYAGGIFILKEEGGEFQRIQKKDGLVSNSIWDFKQFNDSTIWVATQHGVSVLREGEITNYTVEDGLSGSKVYQITEDQEGNKWFATSDGISIWDGEEFRSVKKINGVDLGYVFDVKTATDGDVWIGTESKGVFVFDGSTYRHFTRENGLSSNYIYTFFEDAENNMWIATDENGVNLYRGDAFKFYGENFGVSSDGILSVTVDSKDVIWLGTEKGIDSFDGEKITHHPLPEKYAESYVWEIEELPNGNLLLLMPDNTLLEYDGNRYQNFTKEHGLKQWFIYDVFIDSQDIFWLATDYGIIRLNDGNIEHFTIEDGLVGNIVHHIYENHQGKLYIATTAGLGIYDGENWQKVTIKDGLGHNRINYITEDEKGNIWLGTASGVSVLEPRQSGEKYDITNFGKDEGMHLLDTHFVWFDKEGHLWQGTNGGLNRLNVPRFWETREMRLVHHKLFEEGLGAEFNFKAVAEESAGSAWFGSMEGVMKLDISKLNNSSKSTPLNVYITGIRRNAKTVKWENYDTDVNYETGRLLFPSVTFPHGEHTYTFSFSGLNYRKPENMEYRYKMKGFEDGWSPLSSSSTATYTNLEPGDYTLMIQAVGGSPKRESKITTYQFSVAYPFWQTYWFYALVSVSLIGLIYGYIRVRLGMLEKNRLQELVDERTKDLQEALGEKEVLIKEIHHRVKNNLAVISGLLELQQGYSEDGFSRRVLSESQRRVQSISMIHEKLYQSERLAEINFKKYVKEFIDIVAYSFNYTEKDITVDVDVGDFKLGVDQGIPCGLILNELVSNAYEHAFKNQDTGRIQIKMEEDEEHNIKLIIADNGQGLPEDFDISKSDSLGLSLIDTLSMQLKGDFEFRNTGNGAEFELVFEKKQAPLKVPTEN